MADEQRTEDYDGPARLVLDDRELDVRVRLSGRFEPISGRYQWAGRLSPTDELSAALHPNIPVRLCTEEGEADASIREEDPWGGFRICGTGRPPFTVPVESP
jgi:hypothetical protein